MNVLCVSRTWGKNAGGMERLSYELTTRLQKQPNTAVTIVAYQGPRLLSPLFILTCLPRVVAALKKADVVHIGDPMLSLVGFLVKVFFSKKVAISVHGLDIVYPNFLYQLYLTLFFNHFDLYVPISEHVASLLKKRNLRGNIHVLQPGIEDTYYKEGYTRTDLGHVLNKAITKATILFTGGRLVKRKGQAWFIQHVLPTLSSDTVYVIAGSGPELEHIQITAREAGVVDKVMLLGRVSEESLRILYNTVDAFIQPNIPVAGDVEGFGLVLLEASLCNRPIFAANLEGIKDAIQEGRNGTLLEAQNAEAWITALNSFVPVSSVPSSARAYTLEHFNWDKKIHQFSAELNKL